MINKKYLDLINKDIDKVISPEEKKALLKFLGEDPGAGKIYNELQDTEKLLNNLPERDPSEDLKIRILNSIDYNRYNAGVKSKNILETAAGIFSAIKSRWTLSFTLGAAAAVIVLSVIFTMTNFYKTDEHNPVYGSIGISDTEVTSSFPLDASGISGKIDLIKGSADNGKTHFVFNVNISTPSDYIFELDFDPQNIVFENFSSPDFAKINLERSRGKIKISSSGTDRFSLIVNLRNSLSENAGINIYQNDLNLFSRTVTIK